MEVTLVGHAHVDAVWLWDREETKQVLVETFERILELMDAHTDVTFVQTSAQYFEWLEEEHPGLWNRIRDRVRDGRWEIVGGMWIEPDCNMPSGESLCRQLLLGMRYFREKFSVDVEAAWLPDVFGFSWTLPQILSDAGLKYFFTSKLIWQTRLPFPHNVFWWEAPDGSRVLGYQTPGLYNNVDLYEVNKQAMRFRAATGLEHFLAPYGEGDHGGGLREELVQSVRKNPYDVNIAFGNAHEYFSGITQQLDEATPVVRDELYLNTHRGTLTTQAFMKRLNRKAEGLLGTAEAAAVVVSVSAGLRSDPYALTSAWKKLLFNQFHDALPGSSIRKVYEDAGVDFKEILVDGQRQLDQAMALIGGRLDTASFHHPILVSNMLGWERSGIVEVLLSDIGVEPDKGASISLVDTTGRELPTQIVARTGEDPLLVFRAQDLPPAGYEVFDLVERRSEGPSSGSDLQAQALSLENSAIRVSVSSETGFVTSIYDKVANVECVEGVGGDGANFLELFQDETTKESAWNICRGRVLEVEPLGAPELVDDGPLVKTVRSQFVFKQTGRADTTFRAFVSLYAGEPEVHFRLDVDWNAAFVTAKVGFDLREMGEYAEYQIPYGAIVRKDSHSPDADPYEREKWEVSAHTWVSCCTHDGTRSVALFNDSKYAFSQDGSRMSMTLLRSPQYPNPASMGLASVPDGHTDQGTHSVRYAVRLYANETVVEQGVPNMQLHSGLFRRGAEFNVSPVVRALQPHEGTLPGKWGLLKNPARNIVVTAIKPAESGEGLILRMLETEGVSTDLELHFVRPVSKAQRVTILEQASDILCEVDGSKVRTVVSAHQLVTLQVWLGDATEKRDSAGESQ